MKGFTKDGKFRPTGKKSKSTLKKKDIPEHRDKKIMGVDCGCDERKRKLKSFLHKMETRNKDMVDYGNSTDEEIENMKRMQSDEAIELIHSNYNNLMIKTANNKGGIYDEGKVQRFIGDSDNRELENVEAFCGASTDAIETMIWDKLGKHVGHPEVGFYTNEDRSHSESFNFIEDETQHEWFRLPDGTIIDNACGQFQEDNLNRDLGKAHRLRIIRPDDPRQDDYQIHRECSECGTHLKNGKCSHCNTVKIIEGTPEFKSGMEMIEIVELYRSQGRTKELGLAYKETL